MSWYTTGTVSLTNGSKTVTGIGTKWANPLIGVCAGQMLILKTANTIEICEIASVQSDMQLTLANQYSGASKKGVSYEIPTAPKVSIEALALRISEMLNYYQQQMNGWQSILTGEEEVTLTAPDGKIVTIKSQKAITEAIQKINVNGIGCRNVLSDVDSFQLNGFGFIDDSTVGNKPFRFAEIIQSGNGKFESTQIALDLLSNRVKIRSGRANKWNEWCELMTSANINADTIGAIPATKTVVNGAPIYKVGSHFVYSDWIGQWALMPFRANELPFGWYFRNGDNYLLSSPQGQALNGLSVNYKRDHRITIKTINGKQYINVPNAFHSDGRGFFERAANGTTRQVGHIEDDKIRNITGGFGMDGIAGSAAGVIWGGYGPFYENGTNPSTAKYSLTEVGISAKMGFDASRVVPTANENRPINIGLTPTIYLGV